MSYPPDMLEPLEPREGPTETVEFRRELASLLNRHGVDNWAEIPDHILADMLAEIVPTLRWGRIATAKWMDQPLLGEKLSASLRQPGAWVEDTTPADGNLYPPGDPRGFVEYQSCPTDLCAAQRQHTVRCGARQGAGVE